MPLNLAILAILLLGHIALWVAVFNRTHSFNLPRRLIHWTEFTQIAGAIGMLLCLAYWLTREFTSFGEVRDLIATRSLLAGYSWLSLAFGGWTVVAWARRQWVGRRTTWVASESRLHDLTPRFSALPVRGLTTRLCARLPTNQMFSLETNVKDIVLPRLPRELDGFTIVHLSDLHFTGKIGRPFFDEIMAEAIALRGDAIALTGDIQEEEECHDWLEPTLGRLAAGNPAFFVLGNHDKRLASPERLRRTLTELGWTDLGIRPQVREWRGREVQLAGNERPWFPLSAELSAASWLNAPPAEPGPFRIVLAHSPDQLRWARRSHVDLVLAGHTHGGHIRLPGVGPIACPSWHGVRYACGVFHEPPTVMHVSRGISGLDPVRFNCPPEITKLRLRSPS